MFYRKYVALPINKIMGNFFVAVSNTTKKAILEKLKIDESRIRVIYNGIDDNIRPGNKLAARQKVLAKHNVDKSKKLILAVGRIDPIGKNLLNLVHAIDVMRQKHPESSYHFLLVGESNFPNAHLVSEEIQKRGLQDLFTLTGHVSVAELNDYFQRRHFSCFSFSP